MICGSAVRIWERLEDRPRNYLLYSVVLAGHKTRVSLENAFWQRLKYIARSRQTTLSDLITVLMLDREHGNLSSALRLFVLSQYQAGVEAAAQKQCRSFLTD